MSGEPDVPTSAPEGACPRALGRGGPDVPAEELEDLQAPSVEVRILWGCAVLHVQHLTPPRSYHLGEAHAGDVRCDFIIPRETLGATLAPLVLAERGGAVSVVVPRGARGTLEISGQPVRTVEEAIEQGRTEPCGELPGARHILLPPGSKANIELGDMVFQVSTGNAGRAFAAGLQVDALRLRGTGVSLALHAGLLATSALFAPSGVTDDDDISPEQQVLVQQYIQALRS